MRLTASNKRPSPATAHPFRDANGPLIHFMPSTQTEPSPDPTFDLERIVARLKKNFGILLMCLLVSVAIGLGYTFLSEAKYEARTTLFFPPRPPSVLGQSGVTDASAGASLLGAAGPTPLKIFRGFLESQTALDYVAARSSLPRQKIVDIRSFSEDSAASMLTVSIILADQAEAKTLLTNHLAALTRINATISEKYVRDESQTLVVELSRQTRVLAEADRRLIEFEKSSGSAPSLGVGPSTSPATINKWQEQLLRAQTEYASISAAIDKASERFRAAVAQGGEAPIDIPPVKKLRPLLVDAESELRLKRKTLGDDAPEIRHLKLRIAELQGDLKRELNRYLSSVQKGLLDPTDGGGGGSADVTGMLLRQVSLEAEIKSLTPLATVAPDEAGTLTKLARIVAIQTEIVRTATLQLETAKLLALRDPNKWSLLDPPRIMEKPVNKRYGTVTAVCAAIGLFIGILWAMNFGRRPD